ncbi:hypothetical protein C1895_28895 [Pseudomonas sp. FW305-3-2-15-E-TSA4]|nr:hypothetical protein C1895_28895 [Pseudomonas sp. FW305-3-2-15-E-TSA4]
MSLRSLLFSRFSGTTRTPVGAGLLANAVVQSISVSTDPPHSRASPLPQWDLWCIDHRGLELRPK